MIDLVFFNSYFDLVPSIRFLKLNRYFSALKIWQIYHVIFERLLTIVLVNAHHFRFPNVDLQTIFSEKNNTIMHYKLEGLSLIISDVT